MSNTKQHPQKAPKKTTLPKTNAGNTSGTGPRAPRGQENEVRRN